MAIERSTHRAAQGGNSNGNGTGASTAGVPPHDLEAESSVLGSILLSDRWLDPLLIDVGLKADDFYRERHRLIYKAMIKLKEASEPIDTLTVSAQLREVGELEQAGGADYVQTLVEKIPSIANARQYGRIVKENALLRGLLRASQEIQESIAAREGDPQQLLERAQQKVFEVAHDSQSGDFRPIGDILHDELEKLESLSLDGQSLTGTPSGFRDIDELTGGFQKGNLIIIAARPSMGKSALVTNMAENAALAGYPVALFSLEMSQTELAQRFIASQAKIDGDALRKGKVKKESWPAVIRAAGQLSDAPLWIDDSSDINILELRAKARRLHGKAMGSSENGQGLGLVIIDYLQLLRAGDSADSRVEQVSQMSRGLKVLARELNIPVIAVSQLSRAVESRPGARPQLSDLRECVTGDTLVWCADGRRVPIRELVGKQLDVYAVDENDRVVVSSCDRVWNVGKRPVFEVKLASGRSIKATAEHKIRSGRGWMKVGELDNSDRVAIAARVPEPTDTLTWPARRIALMGQMIGGGRYRSGQSMRYTAATTWFRALGIFNQRSHQKRIPSDAFRLDDQGIACLLRHLWATDGSIWSGVRVDGRRTSRVAYSTSSERLASDVSALLLRLGIVARINRSDSGPRPMYDVLVSGAAAERRFIDTVGVHGSRRSQAAALAEHLAAIDRTNPNVDTLPSELWTEVKRAMSARAVSQPAMAAARGTSYGGTSHFSISPSRETINTYATRLESPQLARSADAEIFWDSVIEVKPIGVEEVFDLTVPGPACWLADGIVTHNSGQIEQDADLVAFIYREEYYLRDESTRPGEADIIVAKHRNGPVKDVSLAFMKHYPKFGNLAPSYMNEQGGGGSRGPTAGASSDDTDLDEF